MRRHSLPYCRRAGFRRPVLYTSADSAGPMRMVQAGTLDDPNAVTPTVAIYVKDALSWDRIDSGVAKFEQLPPAPPRV
jgi:hypothetical protein